jgi:hypothetical protein
MDIAFRGQLGECVVVYLDDVTIFWKNREDHISHLKKVFDRCRIYGISLNPKKSVLVVNEGKLLGFIMLAQGQTRGSMLQQRTNKTLTIGPFGNTCEEDEVSPEVEAGVVAGLRCLQP